MIKTRNNQDGVTIFISILVLASVVVLAVAISDIVIRASQSSNKISLSEIAYFAAEASVEKALYSIEKNRTIVSLNSSGNLEEITAASWDRTVSEVATLTIECATLDSNQGICVDDAGAITPSNPLQVNLDAGSSFQLDLDFAGLVLPNNLQVSWDDNDGKVITFITAEGSREQTVIVGPPRVAQLNDLDGNQYIVRLVNNDPTSLITFTLAPSGGGNLPIGILITSNGSYADQERVIEVERTNWQIY